MPVSRPPLILTTSRLRLRPWRESDLAPFAAMNADDRVMEHFLRPLDRAESDALAARANAHLATKGWGLWAVEVAGDGRFIGFAGLAEPSWQAHFTPCIEVGWRLSRGAWGKGYATEAGQAAIRHGFEVAGLAGIVSFTSLVNTRSIAVMERLGMRRDGEFDHPAIAEGHRLRRHVLYRIARGPAAV